MAIRGFRAGGLGLLLAFAAGSFALPTPAMAAEPPPLAAFGELPAVEQMAMSPDGEDLAVVARIKGERRLVVLDGAHQVRATLPLGDAKIRELDWSDVGHVCITLSKTEDIGPDFTKSKIEAYYTAVVPIDGAKPQFVFAKSEAMLHAVFGGYGFRTINGKHLGFFGGLENKRTADGIGYEFMGGSASLFAVDLDTMAPRKLAVSPIEGHDRDWLVNEQGVVVATLDLVRNSGNWSVTAARGNILANGNDPGGHVSLLALGRDGNTAVLSKRESRDGETHWYEVPLAGGALVEIFPGIRIERIYVDPANGRMIGYLPDNGEAAPVPVLYDAEKQEKLRKVYRAFPKLQVEIKDFTGDISHVLVRTSGNGDPGTWFSVAIGHRRADGRRAPADRRSASRSGQHDHLSRGRRAGDERHPHFAARSRSPQAAGGDVAARRTAYPRPGPV